MARRRNPEVLPDGKASITQAAKDLAAELNELRAENKALQSALGAEAAEKKKADAERRRVTNARKQREARARRNGTHVKRQCQGLNMVGQPCKQAPLIPENWDGDTEISGNFCLHHDPDITTEERLSYRATSSAKSKVYRRVTPGEMAHELIQRSPQYFLRPYLESLGLRMDDEGNLDKVGTGLKLHGFSRGGEVVKSSHPDYEGQVRVAEKLLDRIYGKARQSVDVASNNSTVHVTVAMDLPRISEVAGILQAVGGLNGHLNGHNGHALIEGTAVDLDEVLIDAPNS